MSFKNYWRILLLLLLVGLLTFGTALTAFAGYPDPCTGPKVEPISGDDLDDLITPSPGNPAFPDPDPAELSSPDDCDLVYYKVVDEDGEDIKPGDIGEDGMTFTSNGFEVTLYEKWLNNDDDEDAKAVFAFESNLPVMYVYAKGGPDEGNLYQYYDEYPDCVTEDCGLSQQPGGDWSHIAFYYCVPEDEEELEVSKTVDTSFTREHFWDIAKEVETEGGYELDDVAKIWLYTDGSGDEAATWTVDVSYEGYEDSGFNVSGEITIENIGDLDAVITDIEDKLASDKIAIYFDENYTGEYEGDPIDLVEGATLTLYYREFVDSKIEGDNEVTITTERDSYSADPVAIVWGDPDVEINETVNIEDLSDLFGKVDLGSVTAPNGDTFTYTEDFAWEDYEETGSYTFNNTATIVETEQSASAVLKVNVQDYDDETAYAKGDNAICFIPTFSNWGWTNPIKPGEYTWDLWAGAAQCDTSKGMLVGSVDVDYDDDGTLTVEFEVDDDYILIETHVYAGEDKFPQQQRGRRTVDTVAPGQYYIEDDLSGEIYVIAHAVVGIPDPDFGPDSTNSESENDNNEANESEEASNTIEDQVENNRGRPDNPGSHGRGRR